jgi:hypothetical protein
MFYQKKLNLIKSLNIKLCLNLTNLTSKALYLTGYGSIISHAFEMYKGIFLYAIVSMIIYVIADSILESITGFNLEFWREYQRFKRRFFQLQVSLFTWFLLYSFFRFRACCLRYM